MGIALFVLGSVLIIMTLVLVHEWGHYIVARCCGVHVLRFSIGFGRPIVSWTNAAGTQFCIAWLPLGGYVQMQGEDMADPSTNAVGDYARQPVWQRMAIVLAGPMINFVFAMILYWALALSGITHIKPVVGSITPGSPAAVAALQPKDHIVALEGAPTKDWQAFMMRLVSYAGQPAVRVTIQRPTEVKLLTRQLPISSMRLDSRTATPLAQLGIAPYQPKFPMTLGRILPDTPAAAAGLHQGDVLRKIGDQSYHDMRDVLRFIHAHPNNRSTWTIERNGQMRSVVVELGRHDADGKASGFAGFVVVPPTWPASLLHTAHYSVFSAWLPAVNKTLALIGLNFKMLGKLVTGNVSFSAVGGPISIVEMAGRASQHGFKQFIEFMAFLSIALGFVNILPVPGLDGGHFVLLSIEGLRRRALARETQLRIIQIGFVLILIVMLSATFNDVARLLF